MFKEQIVYLLVKNAVVIERCSLDAVAPKTVHPEMPHNVVQARM